MHILDNEISAEYKLAIETNQVNFKLVTSYDHRRNITEKKQYNSQLNSQLYKNIDLNKLFFINIR